MPQKKSELYVLTKAKELSKYVITVTEKSPKKFRFTLSHKVKSTPLGWIFLSSCKNSEIGSGFIMVSLSPRYVDARYLRRKLQ